MFRKVNPNLRDSNQISLSRTSYFVRFLLKICFFPVYIEGDKIMFRLFSCKTFVHVTLSFGLFSSFVVIGFILSGFTEVAMSMMLSVSLRTMLGLNIIITRRRILGSVETFKTYWIKIKIKTKIERDLDGTL